MRWRGGINLYSFASDNFLSFVQFMLSPPNSLLVDCKQKMEFTLTIVITMVTMWRMRNEILFQQSMPNFQSSSKCLKNILSRFYKPRLKQAQLKKILKFVILACLKIIGLDQ